MNNIKMSEWHEDDLPGNKLLLNGRSYVTDVELLSIIIGTGTKGENAVSLANRVMMLCNRNLADIGKLSVSELMGIKGIGKAKALAIAAAVELGRRKHYGDYTPKEEVRSSRDLYMLLAPKLDDLPHEESYVVFMNRKNKVLGIKRLSVGGSDATIMDANVVYRCAIEGKAKAIAVGHNHPSGSLRPSQADIDLTKRLKAYGETIGIPLIDHVIVADSGYYSFLDEGLI